MGMEMGAGGEGNAPCCSCCGCCCCADSPLGRAAAAAEPDVHSSLLVTKRGESSRPGKAGHSIWGSQRRLWECLLALCLGATCVLLLLPLSCSAAGKAPTDGRLIRGAQGLLLESICGRLHVGYALRQAALALLSTFLSEVILVVGLVATCATRYAVEPLAVALVLDTLLLTAWGLLYQAWWRLAGNQRSTRLSSKIHPIAPNAAAEEKVGWAEPGRQAVQTPEMSWPRVLVQLPMYNEREVYARAIAAACQLSWPRSCLVIQVLDDSTDEEVSVGMRLEVEEWRQRGVDVRYRHRTDRKGYKAGNLREGLLEEYAKACKYVAVLDADFEPTPDWLLRIVHMLESDKKLALVQTRWTFSNENENLLTQLQAVELTWHFWAEQLVSSLALRCFGFNGTAGVWRSEAILDAGNWRDDTTVEDMDMAVCAAMRGWKMQMSPTVECLSEVPASYAAYRKQQHRWTSGPASLLRQRLWSIACTPGQALGWGAKLYLVAFYILLRRALKHLVGCMLWVLLSLWMLVPCLCALVNYLGTSRSMSMAACNLPQNYQHLGFALSAASPIPFPWAALTFALVYPLCLLCFSPRKVHLYPAYLLFMSGMLPCRVHAVLAGLLDLKSSRTWDVTQKLGKKIGTEKMGQDSLDAGAERKGCGVDDSVTQLAVSVEQGLLLKQGARQVPTCPHGTNVKSAKTKDGKQRSSSIFKQEVVMGWCLLVVFSVALSWDIAFSWEHRRLFTVLPAAWPALCIYSWMFLQGCWNLWIGGSL